MKFSIEKFCYYLLSKDFVDAYIRLIKTENEVVDIDTLERFIGCIWSAIFSYQAWDLEPLQYFLSKI